MSAKPTEGDGAVELAVCIDVSGDVPLRPFGAERIESGGEFESIASGLALIGHETDLDLWSERAGK